jgi:hypothetical protein
MSQIFQIAELSLSLRQLHSDLVIRYGGAGGAGGGVNVSLYNVGAWLYCTILYGSMEECYGYNRLR